MTDKDFIAAAEKYGTPRITLSPEAVNLLMSYRWPGNIRQLKNIAETISALESYDARGPRKEIGAATLERYIPKDSPSMLPVAVERRSGMSDADRQEIFKALYSLNAEVARLRSIVEGGQKPAAVAPAEHLPEPTQMENDIDIQDEPDYSITAASEDLIRKALEKHGGNRKKAAEELGISERTLYRKLPPEYRTQRTK